MILCHKRLPIVTFWYLPILSVERCRQNLFTHCRNGADKVRRSKPPKGTYEFNGPAASKKRTRKRWEPAAPWENVAERCRGLFSCALLPHGGIELPGNSIPQCEHYSQAQRETVAHALQDWDEPQRRQVCVLARTHCARAKDECDGLRTSTRPNCTGRPLGTRLASRLPSTSTRGGGHASPSRMSSPPPARVTGTHGSSRL